MIPTNTHQKQPTFFVHNSIEARGEMFKIGQYRYDLLSGDPHTIETTMRDWHCWCEMMHQKITQLNIAEVNARRTKQTRITNELLDEINRQFSLMEQQIMLECLCL